MDGASLLNQFYSFYGASVAPYDLTILSSSPELLILIDFITQYEGAQISHAAHIDRLLKSVPATPDGLAEAIASFVVPLSEKYRQEFQKTPALAHLGEKIFTVLQLNIIIRLACCICITIIKQGKINEDLLRKLNEFSGQIGLFHNSQRGPLEIPVAVITEVESSVSVIEGPASANNSKALTRRGGVRRKLRQTRRRQQKQKGGGKLFAALLSLLGITGAGGRSLPSATPAPPAPGAVQLNQTRGVFIGANIPGRPPVSGSISPAATSTATSSASVSLGAGGEVYPAGGAGAAAATFIANAGPGFVGWDATTEVIRAVDFAFETLLANTTNLSANLPYANTSYPKSITSRKLAAANFASLSFPEVSSAAFTVTTPTGNHTVLEIFSLPPLPGLLTNVVSLNTLGICSMKLAGLQYLSNTLTEISAALTSHTTQPITSGGLNNFQEIGIGSDTLIVGTRSTVAGSFETGANRVGFYHAHPVIFDRLHSIGSDMDWDGFVINAIINMGTLNIISTQTGLLVYTFHPEILKGLASPSFSRHDAAHKFKMSFWATEFRGTDVPLVKDSNNKVVNTWIHGLAPGRYKVVAPCANRPFRAMSSPVPEGCETPNFELVMGDAKISVPYLFDIALVPYQLVLRGLANIPVYSLSAPTGLQMPSSRGFTMSANASSESLVLRYQASNNIVVPNIPRLFSVDVSCFKPESVFKGFDSYPYQQRCLFQLYRSGAMEFSRDKSFYSKAHSGPWKLGDEIVEGAVDPREQSSAAITAIIAPGLAAIQQAFTIPP